MLLFLEELIPLFVFQLKSIGSSLYGGLSIGLRRAPRDARSVVVTKASTYRIEKVLKLQRHFELLLEMKPKQWQRKKLPLAPAAKLAPPVRNVSATNQFECDTSAIGHSLTLALTTPSPTILARWVLELSIQCGSGNPTSSRLCPR